MGGPSAGISPVNGENRSRLDSQYDPFDLIERDLIVSLIVVLRCSRTLVRRHLLRVFEQPAIAPEGGGEAAPRFTRRY
jgi:hypothetical protein